MAAKSSDALAAIVGVGYTAVTRGDERPLGLVAREAALAAIADAGVGIDEIDGYVGEPSAANRSARHDDGVDEVSGAYVSQLVGLHDVSFVADVRTMGAWIGAGAAALSAGLCRYVLAVRAMEYPRGVKYNVARHQAYGGSEQFAAPYGLGPLGGHYAMWLRRYMHDNGASREDLFRIVKTFRDFALDNPIAYWRDRTISEEEYMGARVIADPLCIFDYDLPVTGAGALVMTRCDLIGRSESPAALVRVCRFCGPDTPILPFDGWSLSDIQCAQLYDGFSPFVLDWLERMGVAPPGEAHAFVRTGGIAKGGLLPVNTFGGSLGEGRLHGIGHMREAAQQVRGRAGLSQVDDAHACLVQIGTPAGSWMVVLTSP